MTTTTWTRAALAALATLCSAAIAQPAPRAVLDAARLAANESIIITESPIADQGVSLEFTALGRRHTIDLQPHSVRAPNATLVLAAGAQRTPAPWPAPATFRGLVRNVPDSLVAAAIVNGRWRLIIDQGPDSPGGLLFVQPWSEFPGGPADGPADGYAAYTQADVLPGDWSCGTGPAHFLAQTSPPSYGNRVACNTLAQVAFDADFEFYQANGSNTANVVADIESVLNAVNIIYARDTSIVHQISHTLIRTTEPDPYTTANAGGLLEQFAAEWQQNQTGVTRDIAHLMTGREIDGNVIGVAYVGAVCTYGYGYSQSRFTTNLSGRVGLTAHEIGHNWGAGHCDGDSDCYIMCSGIGGCSGSVTRFGSRSMRDIRAFVPTRTCLEPTEGVTTPLAPRPQNDTATTLTNAPVRIDVLANDFDGNCEVVTIHDFPARATCGHGSLTRSTATGPGGRDEILYTPDAGYSGADCFTYRARDPGGRVDFATVNVNVLQLRTPENPAFTQPGLDATYYHTFPQELADLALTTPYATENVPTINFPGSNGPFAGSGRSVGVGAVFTGTLNIATAGSYTFFTESDDGSALYVNGLIVVANDGLQGMVERQGTLTLPVGPAQVRVEYFQGAGGLGLIARLQGPGLAKQVIPAAMWSAPGVRADYHNLGDETSDFPNVSSLTPASRGVVASLNQPTVDPFLFSSVRRSNIGASFAGYFNAPAPGLYTFYTTSDDASYLYIGGTLIVTNGGAHGMVERSGSAALLAGRHSIRIDYQQGAGGAGLIVEAAGPGLSRAPVAPANFSRPAPGTADCNADGISDAVQVKSTLNLGDMIAGGTGRGTAPLRAGVNASNGGAVPATAFGSSGTLGTSAYNPLNGLNSRPNYPRVEAVLVPHGTTQIAPGITRAFPSSGGPFTDAIRNGATVFAAGTALPIFLSDQPTTARPGLGLPTDSGITFDLAEIRAAEGGRRIFRVQGMAGLTRDSCYSQDIHAEVQVLVDGVERFRSLISTQTTPTAAFDLPLSDTDRYLTLISLNADGANCDHVVIGDARLVIASELDADGDGVPDECACPADFNRDGGVDGADVEAFFLAWEAAAPSADVNHDGGIDGGDVEAFFTAWERGGC